MALAASDHNVVTFAEQSIGETPIYVISNTQTKHKILTESSTIKLAKQGCKQLTKRAMGETFKSERGEPLDCGTWIPRSHLLQLVFTVTCLHYNVRKMS